MKTQMRRALAVTGMLLVAGGTLKGQAPDATDVRARLQERFEVVALQDGLALVPRDTGTGVRLIQIVDGVITVDGQPVSGSELRSRIGGDADLVLRASYGGAVGQPQASSPAPAPASGVTRTRVRSGDLVRFGGDVNVGREERVEGDVVAIMGSASVAGEVTGDVVVVMGSLDLGNDAVVRGDVNVVGGRLNRGAGAQVLGDLNEVGVGGAMGGMRGVDIGRGPGGRDRRFRQFFGSLWSGVGGLAATVARVILMVLAAVIVAAVGRTTVERIAARAAAVPVRAGLVGLAAELLFVPLLVVTVVVLAISIVGIPLILLVPFAAVLVMLGAFVGYTGLAYRLGTLLTGRFGWTGRGFYEAVAVGVVALAGVTLLGKLAGLASGFMLGAPLVATGYLIEYIAWTIGFGAAVLAGVDWQRQRGVRVGPEAPSPDVSPQG